MVAPLCIALFVGAAEAQEQFSDRVILKTASGGQVVLRCRIVDYTGHVLAVVTKSQTTPKTYPAEQIVSIETRHVDSHRRGIEALARDRIEEARPLFEHALTAEDRPWVRREIVAQLIRCALGRGEYGKAASRFVALLESDPQTRHFALIPLLWAPQEAGRAAPVEATLWLEHRLQAARLIGASFLLVDQRHGEQALRELNALATSTDQRIRALAAAQKWRLDLAAGGVNELALERWQYHVEYMPEDLRGGPYYLLGRARSVRREFEPAAIAFLWLPLVAPEDRHLAARSCLEAADALAELGQHAEAANTYREVIRRFRTTPFAQEAADVLKSLQAKEPPGVESAKPANADAPSSTD